MMKEDEPIVLDRLREPEAAPRPCCCCLDVRIGTILIGLFNLVFHSASFIIASQVMAHPKVYRDEYAEFGSHRMEGDNFVGMSLAFFSFLITVLLIYGALMRKPGLILPFFAIQVFDVVLFILGAAGAITYGPALKIKLENCPSFLYKNEVSRMSVHSFMFALVFTCLLVMLFKVYLMSCVWECYNFVKRQIERRSQIDFYPSMLDMPELPNYEEAMKMPKEMPPPYSTNHN
ncbi:lysosomal-associated transmembrane protein 4A-like [Rhopilema esculentum]|uniref:lysosomal-associated transmembrane protein 4A-like n=1 Tax=Rhopilema esculentum TaxID=499914 RepID=UPI0031E0851E